MNPADGLEIFKHLMWIIKILPFFIALFAGIVILDKFGFSGKLWIDLSLIAGFVFVLWFAAHADDYADYKNPYERCLTSESGQAKGYCDAAYGD